MLDHRTKLLATISFFIFLLLAAACSKKKGASPDVIGQVTTLAGSETQGSADGKGTQASFNSIWGIAADASGNIYVTDAGLNQIRKITPDGMVVTLPDNAKSTNGTGFPPQYIDPLGVAVDRSGNIYISYYASSIIRKITPDGKGSVFAGDGMFETKDGTGTSAGISQPFGLAADKAGNIYVAAGSIRKISPTAVVTTLAGKFSLPSGITVDANGNIYVADTGDNLISKITPDGVVSTIAGSGSYGHADGQGNAASFNNPSGIAIDNTGNLYVADTNNSLIRKITPAGVVTTLAGNSTSGDVNGVGTAASFYLPTDVAVSPDGKFLYVADRGNNQVRQIVIK